MYTVKNKISELFDKLYSENAQLHRRVRQLEAENIRLCIEFRELKAQTKTNASVQDLWSIELDDDYSK